MATKNYALDKVQTYLEKRAKEDLLFADNYKDKSKTLTGCWCYIVSEAKKKAVSNCACIDDEDVYQWAVHYYTEKSIKEVKPTPVKVTTSTEPTKPVEQPKKTISLIPKPQSKSKAKKETKNPQVTQLSLFDF